MRPAPGQGAAATEQRPKDIRVLLRTIAVPLTTGSDAGPGLPCAIAVANSIRAHVDGVSIRWRPDAAHIYSGTYPSGRIVLRPRGMIDEIGKTALPHSLRSAARQRPTAVLPEAARDTDLTLFIISDGGPARILRKATLLRSGCPALFAPRARAAATELQRGLTGMGGHGRLRYSGALFGGVTRNVIRSASIPGLMTH